MLTHTFQGRAIIFIILQINRIKGQALHKQYCQTPHFLVIYLPKGQASETVLYKIIAKHLLFLVIYLTEGQTQRLPHSPQGDNNEKTKSQEYRRKLLPYSKQMYLQSVFTGGYR